MGLHYLHGMSVPTLRTVMVLEYASELGDLQLYVV